MPEVVASSVEDDELSYEDPERTVLEECEEGAREYLLRGWFYDAMEAVRNARLINGLTQAEVADKMGTTQSAVARLENAHLGNFSLDRFLRYAWECGVAPLDLEFVPAQRLRQYALHDPSAPRTAQAFRWQPISSHQAFDWQQIFSEVTPATSELARPSEALALTASQSLASILNATHTLSDYLRSAFTVKLNSQSFLSATQQVSEAVIAPKEPSSVAPESLNQQGLLTTVPERGKPVRAA